MGNPGEYKLKHLIDQIEWVDKMIKSHKGNPSPFMREQYETEKEELLGQLIDNLVDPHNRSPYSFKLIRMAIAKYYPGVVKRGKSIHITKDRHYNELKALETALA